MIRAILATNFKELNDYILQNVKGIDVVVHDIQTQMEVMVYLRESNPPDILILSDMLRGDQGLAEFLDSLMEAKDGITRVYYLATEYPEVLVKALAKHGITYFKRGTQRLEDFIQIILQENQKEKTGPVVIRTRVVKEVEYQKEIQSVFKKVVAVYSPLNQGASTVAAHLAAALAKAGEYKVCLADFNPLQPRVREIYGMSGGYHLGNAIDGIVKGNFTPGRMEEITRESRTQRGIDLLLGLENLNDYYETKVDHYEEIIEKLKISYDYVICDTHSWYDVDATHAAMRSADRVVVPVRGNPYSLEQLHGYLQMFEKYQDFDTRKFGIVINQYGGEDLTCLELQSKCNYPIMGFISWHRLYHKKNAFKDKKLMDEYIPILQGIGIDARKKGSLLDRIIRRYK